MVFACNGILLHLLTETELKHSNCTIFSFLQTDTKRLQFTETRLTNSCSLLYNIQLLFSGPAGLGLEPNEGYWWHPTTSAPASQSFLTYRHYFRTLSVTLQKKTYLAWGESKRCEFEVLSAARQHFYLHQASTNSTFTDLHPCFYQFIPV